MNDTATKTDTEAMLDAHALCGRLIEDMPDGVVFSSWEIMPGYVGGEYSAEDSRNSAKRGLAMLANRFGLVYAEEPKSSLVHVNASGEIDGVQVQLWAHIGRPRAGQTEPDEKRSFTMADYREQM